MNSITLTPDQVQMVTDLVTLHAQYQSEITQNRWILSSDSLYRNLSLSENQQYALSGYNG